MTIALPDFSDKRCYSLSLCGEVSATTEGLPLGFAKADKWDYGQYKIGTQIVRVRVGRVKPPRPGLGYHLHLDFATQGWGRLLGGKPKKVQNRKDIQAVLANLVGQIYSATATARFKATRAELPPFIEYTSRPVKSGAVELEMQGGFYMVRGAPVFSVSWSAPVNRTATATPSSFTQQSRPDPLGPNS